MRHFFIFCVVIILFGCNSLDRPRKPNNLIAEDKMSEIIYDVFLLNSAKGINKKVLENNGIMPQDHVYKKHNIDSLQFALSNDYYAYDTKTYEKIMQKVKQKIEAEKIIVDALIAKEKKTADSLNKIKIDSLSKVKRDLKLSDSSNRKIRAISKKIQ